MGLFDSIKEKKAAREAEEKRLEEEKEKLEEEIWLRKKEEKKQKRIEEVTPLVNERGFEGAMEHIQNTYKYPNDEGGYDLTIEGDELYEAVQTLFIATFTNVEKDAVEVFFKINDNLSYREVPVDIFLNSDGSFNYDKYNDYPEWTNPIINFVRNNPDITFTRSKMIAICNLSAKEIIRNIDFLDFDKNIRNFLINNENLHSSAEIENAYEMYIFNKKYQ